MAECAEECRSRIPSDIKKPLATWRGIRGQCVRALLWVSEWKNKVDGQDCAVRPYCAEASEFNRPELFVTFKTLMYARNRVHIRTRLIKNSVFATRQ